MMRIFATLVIVAWACAFASAAVEQTDGVEDYGLSLVRGFASPKGSTIKSNDSPGQVILYGGYTVDIRPTEWAATVTSTAARVRNIALSQGWEFVLPRDAQRVGIPSMIALTAAKSGARLELVIWLFPINDRTLGISYTQCLR